MSRPIDPRKYRRFVEGIQNLSPEEAAEYIQEFNRQPKTTPGLFQTFGEIAEQVNREDAEATVNEIEHWLLETKESER